ncbi:sec1 family domain-containing protein [Trichoderma breve]|uniref:Sec1 family domain-containing protein n=1 Tax=Trichoderma breve TaxID=2034170 RepID=A0A9W9B2Z9_9HYPO|nr:sec1 family domain-containing protein [Trichoderma breve]KAJ4854875.1 sec1 family domain-containing protein [Trichoderma breve]
MGLSVFEEQHNVILQEIKNITQNDWKCLIVDETSKKIVDNVVKSDDILNNNIATIELIEARRESNPEMDAIYLLSPEPHIVECLLADFELRRYRRGFLVWTNLLDPALRRKIDEFPGVRQLRASSRTLFVDFYPRESHLVTFRDPWSFPMLYHPACNAIVPKHMQLLAQRIAGICITLGEYPKVRYYRPKNAFHEASVLCTHLARFVQEELDSYAQWDSNFPPPSTRPQSTLLITDRSMDLMAPLVHEFTYQAMAHDLLPIKDGDKVTFHTVINEGTPDAAEKDMELQEKDKIWVENRHRHMKDTIDKLMGDFQKFLDQNPHFTRENTDTTSLSAIRDMMAGLPQFQEMKEAYSLHLTMAQECMNKFQHHKLSDTAAIEQTLATGLDEDYKKPKNILDSVARLLDDDAVSPGDRLRLITLYALYRDGMILDDVKKLLAHSGLPIQDTETIINLEHIGGRPIKQLKEQRQAIPPLFPADNKNSQDEDDYTLSRFEPVLKQVLDGLTKGTLDQTLFPYVKPPLDPNEDMLAAQRLIVFMAGGATYSESRTCYELGNERSRDIILATSHMLTPQLFLRQIGDLSRDKRQLDLPIERKRHAPAHLFERPAPPPPPVQARPPQQQAARPGAAAHQPVARPGGLPSRPTPSGGAVPTQAMANMHINSSGHRPTTSNSSYDDGKAHKEKKRRNFLGLKK